jgi:hypothetical protein
MTIEGKPYFDKLTLDNFKPNSTALGEIQKLIPNFGRTGAEGKLIGHGGQFERPGQAYGY